MMRSQIRMDVPYDKRNTFGWHQDSAYDKLNNNPKNGGDNNYQDKIII